MIDRIAFEINAVTSDRLHPAEALRIAAAIIPLVVTDLEDARTQLAELIEAERLDVDIDADGADAYVNGLRRAEEIVREGDR